MSVDEARTKLEAGDHPGARAAALEGLQQAPDEPELLTIAGRAGVELGSVEAIDELRRVTELQPDSAVAWSDLGDALATEGRSDEAASAFRRAAELDPDDDLVLAQLGQAEAAAGRSEGAIGHLERVAERAAGSSTAAISLVELYRSAGDAERALGVAMRVADAQPDDVAAQLDVADLALELDRLDVAAAAFEGARRVDDVAEHDLYGLHGLALVAIRHGDSSRALELAHEALAYDERGLTADLALHLDVETGGSGDVLAGRSSTVIARVPPAREEIEAALLAELRDHRRLHSSDERVTTEGRGG